MRLRRCLCLLGVCLLLASRASAQTDSALIARADTLMVHKDNKAAAKILQRVVDGKGPLAPRALVGLAAVAQQREAPNEDVMVLLNQALALAPQDPYVLNSRSNLYMAMHMYTRSFDDLESALRYATTDSARAEYLADQGWDLLNTRRIAEAEALLRKALALDSTNASALNNMGLVMDRQERMDEAYYWMRKYIATDRNNTGAYMNLGFVLSNHGRYAEALAYFDTAEVKGMKEGALYNNRGYAKLKLGDAKGALADIKHSLDLFPGNSYAYRNLGLTYQAMDRRSDACAAFEEALGRGYTKRFGDDVKTIYDAYCH